MENKLSPKDQIKIEKLKLKYELLRDYFEDEFHYMPGFTTMIDFCTGWCPDCKILDYCDIWEETWTKEEIEKEKTK